MTQDLYIIEAKSDLINTDDCIVKIGISANSKQRKKDLKTSTFCELKIIYSTKVAGDARTVEANAHQMLNQYRIRGEWFKIPKQHLKQVKQMCNVLIEVEEQDVLNKQEEEKLQDLVNWMRFNKHSIIKNFNKTLKERIRIKTN
jgi:hypothetical protein